MLFNDLAQLLNILFVIEKSRSLYKIENKTQNKLKGKINSGSFPVANFIKFLLSSSLNLILFLVY